MTRYVFVLYMALFAGIVHASAQQITHEQKAAIIETTAGLLDEHYVFPDKAKIVGKMLVDKLKNRGYDSFRDGEAFIQVLNEDLTTTSSDQHIKITFDPRRVKQIKMEKDNDGKKVPLTKEWFERLRFENFRLRKVEWMDGNIGYFRFLNFIELDVAKEAISASMTFIRHSDAIIIDLRDNGGGHSETLHYLLSYFLPDRQKIGEFHYRKNNRVEEIRIPSDTSVMKIPNAVPLFLLVSRKTSSAAEGMASVLQSSGRAIVVGERTRGEGNPGELFVLNDNLYMMIPTAVSKNVWPEKLPVEGHGVQPDHVIASELALEKAKLEICKTFASSSKIKELKQSYLWQIPVWEYAIAPQTMPEYFRSTLCGSYNEGRQIIYENGMYYYVNKDKQQFRLMNYGQNILAMVGKPFVRIRIPANEEKITYFEFIWDDGFSERVARIE